MKIEKILLPFDGSVHSINAAKFGLDLAKLYGSQVTIVNCYDWRADVSEAPDTLVRDLKLKRKTEAEELLKKAGNIFMNQDVEYKLETIEGSPGYELANRAKSKEYDLIIMGSHGHSDIAGLFLGSVTHKVLNTIYCPILIVP